MLEVKNVSKEFILDGKRKIKILEDVSFVLPDTGLYFCLGKSGSGKSTLLNIIEGLTKPSSGKVFLDGERINKSRGGSINEDLYKNKISIVFQKYNLIEGLTVKDNLFLTANIKNLTNPEEKINKFLKEFSLEDKRDSKVYKLSGGEKQRVAIIRAILNNPKIIFADEPTGAIDEENKNIIMDYFKKISSNCLVFVVTHDKRFIDKYADGYLEISEEKRVKLHNIKEKSDLKSKNHKSKETVKSKIKLLSKLNKKYLCTNAPFNILTFISFLFSLFCLFLTKSINENLKKVENSIIYQYENYNIFEVSSVQTRKVENSLLSINKKECPEDYQLYDFIDESKLNISIYDNLNYFFLNNSISIDNKNYENIVFEPIFSLKGNECKVNEQFKKQYLNNTFEVDQTISFTSKKTYTYYSKIRNQEIEEEINLDINFTIKEVTNDFYYLQTPKVYYSYEYLYQILSLKLANNISILEKETKTYLSLLKEAKNNDEIKSYSKLLLIDDLSFNEFNELLNNKTILENYSMDITNEATMISSSFKSISQIIYLCLKFFNIILLVSSIFITIFINIYTYLLNKKERAILLTLGANDKSIILIYLINNILLFLLSFIFALLLYSPLSKKLSILIEKIIPITFNLSFNTYYALTILILFLLLIVLTLFIAFKINNKNSEIAKDLKEE